MKTALPSRKELKQTKRKTQARKYISRKRPTTKTKNKTNKSKDWLYVGLSHLKTMSGKRKKPLQNYESYFVRSWEKFNPDVKNDA